uniref:Lipocalin/cytosolic fatty-acid binding domain-containing protein n=1 Tax=Pygocentrus nattereri TaxID=42514 RepID=A0A3B4EFG6_PYGNA
MPGLYHGFWKMISNENFEAYLKALDVNIAVRKIATLVFCDKDINQNGDHFIIRTFSPFRSYTMEFDIGQEFEEDLKGIDDRKCKTTVTWDGERLECVQKGEIEDRGWTHWIDNDHLHVGRRGVLEPIPAVIGQKAGYTPDRSPSIAGQTDRHRQSLTHSLYPAQKGHNFYIL